jgi:nucleotide-binding universal stress UspA family protein
LVFEQAGENLMIKDVMVRLDGGSSDATRLAAANEIAEIFDGSLIGLYINILPFLVPGEGGAINSVELLNEARGIGDRIEADLNERLSRLRKPWELRRYDLFSDAMAEVAAREARAADTFVALRPDGVPMEDEGVVEGVIFGSGRHVFLVPDGMEEMTGVRHVVVAWNGSRESARAVAEALPYLQQAERVTVIVVIEGRDIEYEAVLGTEAVQHLSHHGIDAQLLHIKNELGDVGETLLAEVQRLQADLVVLGGYSRSRLRERLLGGVTYRFLHQAPIPLLMAH